MNFSLSRNNKVLLTLGLLMSVGLGVLFWVGMGGPLWAGITQTIPGVANYPYLTVNRAQLDDSTGTVTLVAAVSGQTPKIWGCTITTASATTVEFLSNTTSLTGQMTLNALQIDVPGSNAVTATSIPWLQGKPGEAIVLKAPGPVRVTGQIIWSQE